MCVTDRHDMTLAVKVALNPNTTNHLVELFALSITFHKVNPSFESVYMSCLLLIIFMFIISSSTTAAVV